MRSLSHAAAFLAVATLASAQGSFTVGSTQSFTWVSPPNLIGSADYDGDGDVDLVYMKGTPGAYLELRRNDGPAGFVSQTSIPLIDVPYRCTAADLDGDGIEDIVVSGNTPPQIRLSTGNGSLGAIGWWPQSFLAVTQVVDIDQDGDLDLSDGAGDVALNDGLGGFTSGIVYSDPRFVNQVMEFDDLDGDGDLDLLLTDATIFLPTGPRLRQVLLQQGAGNFVVTGSFFTPTSMTKLLIADVDGDLQKEFVGLTVSGGFGQAQSTNLRIWSVQPGGSVVARPGYPVSAQVGIFFVNTDLAVADVDGDGLDEIAVMSHSFGGSAETVALLAGNASGVPVPVLSRTVPPHGSAPIIFLGDMDGDGTRDLVTAGLGPVQNNPGGWVHLIDQAPIQVTGGSSSSSSTAIELIGEDFGTGFVGETAGIVYGRILDAQGQPMTQATVDCNANLPNGGFALTTVTTDAAGIFRWTPPPAASVGDSPLLVGLGTSGLPALRHRRIYSSSIVVEPDAGGAGRQVRARFEIGGPGSMPLVLAIDLPQPPVPTANGTIHTSILAPMPSFAALDAFGAIGTLDPTLVAAPLCERIFPLPAALIGLPVVMQFYGLESAFPWPRGIVIGPGHFLLL